MQCVKCGLYQADSRTNCIRCNASLVETSTFSQSSTPLQEDINSPLPYQAELEQAIPKINSIDSEGWKSLGVGVFLGAILIAFFPIISFLLHPLITIVHELGHALTAWIFGCPAIPAFDFVYGGGVTARGNRQIPLLLIIYIVLGIGCYLFRNNKLTLVIILNLMLVHMFCIWTTLDEFLFSFMGHGTELIFASIFIYRAISGSSIIHKIERPLYATLGMFMEFYNIRFFYKLYSSADARLIYEEAKGGMGMDFSVIANQFFQGRLVLISLIFVFCCIATPIISFLFFRYKQFIDDFIEKVLVYESV